MMIISKHKQKRCDSYELDNIMDEMNRELVA